MSQLVLGIDTATPRTSVALVSVDPGLGTVDRLAERSHRDPRRHGEVLPTLIQLVLDTAGHQPADIDAVAVGVGPGAYTGLRVGIATAQALGLSLGIPVFGAVTLDAMAFDTGRTEPFAIVTDARRHELFCAPYENYRTPVGEAIVDRPDAIQTALEGVPLLAPEGTPPVPGRTYALCDGPRGMGVCAVVADRQHRGLPTQPTQPLYLRRPDVSPSTGPKSVLP